LDALIAKTEKAPPTLSNLLNTLGEGTGEAGQTLEGREIAQMVGAVQQQIMEHWVIPSEAQGVDVNVVVDVKLTPEGKMLSFQLVPAKSDTGNALYKIVSESVLQLMQNPAWQPLQLPEKYYNIWKNLTFHFNPRQAYG
jgi:hypothetical protein